MSLNLSAQVCADELIRRAGDLRCAVSDIGSATLIDCGSGTPGSLSAGLLLARLCLADRGTVTLVPGDDGPAVQVFSDDPVRACLASQYAGWQVKVEKYFAMGSGPMRAIYGKEAIFEHLPNGRESSTVAIGALETRKAPTDGVIAYLKERLPGVEKLILAYAPCESMAGTLQVVARCLETALHKLHELKFDLTTILSGYGVAPLAPVAADTIRAIGWTNDAILYGGRVVLWVNSDDAQIAEIGPKCPSGGSPDYGSPFAEIFQRNNGDFYKIDPMLFSPAMIEFRNVRTGRVQVFGRLAPDILQQSFGS
ncbi:methenyltetrahydromethanopterin cyclohydrolase [Zavarzinella formosa]|uniref:methenyltetrahydromethanopterin cyclohydrolase n=1 Tax=Zavarzinella formosa TaxID=360055 RepID=UPI000378B653|nr:methenyltetrahydromethanopterin cyclohydrolase [Zavarzinella formosa]